MALSDLVIPTEEFKVRNSSITIRGLNVADIAYLYTHNKVDVDRFAEMWKVNDGEVTQEFIAAVLGELPDLVAKAIACAADEPEAWQNARKLNGPTQLAVINAIGRLTFEGIGVKKFLEGALLFMQGMTAGVKEVTNVAPSIGTGG